MAHNVGHCSSIRSGIYVPLSRELTEASKNDASNSRSLNIIQLHWVLGALENQILLAQDTIQVQIHTVRNPSHLQELFVHILGNSSSCAQPSSSHSRLDTKHE